ncbi:hypothetical protein O181_078475, partial [Austropuccinia psidii MF-1]|nr:hypothetical protein [Austropuccinia psidii MF-1]
AHSQSQASLPVTPSEQEGIKDKGKRHSEGLITAQKWTLIATQRNIKPQSPASIQGKPTLTICTGKITVINPVVTSEGKFPKAVDINLYKAQSKRPWFPTAPARGQRRLVQNQKTWKRTPWTKWWMARHLGKLYPLCHSHFNSTETSRQRTVRIWIKFFSSSNSQRPFSMDHGQQEVQPGIPLGRFWSKFPEDLSQSNRLQRPYGNQQRLTRSRPNQISSGFTQFRNHQISGKESPLFTIPGRFQEKTRIQGQKQDHLQPKEERVRPNDPEAFEFGERSAQEPEVAVHNSRISSCINRNITSNQIENNFITPESNFNSDALWLQMSQYAEQTQKPFAELEASHERMKKFTASMDKIVETLQEGHAQIRKAFEETNKRLTLVF